MQLIQVKSLFACYFLVLMCSAPVSGLAQCAQVSPNRQVKPMPFSGLLEQGGIYNAKVVYRKAGGWWPVGLRIPLHHAVAINWEGLDCCALIEQRQGQGQRLIFTFKVKSKDVREVAGRREWRISYECRIIKVTDVSAAIRSHIGKQAGRV